MTANTETERAEFEAAYVAEKLRILSSEGSEDGEKAIRAVMLRRNANGDYDNSLEAHFAWWAWQAARRAPVVPQGWVLVPAESTEAMARAFRADDAPHYFAMTTIRCNDFAERWRAAIAAAPKQPEPAQSNSPEFDGIKTAQAAAQKSPCKYGDQCLHGCNHIPDAGQMVAAPVQMPDVEQAIQELMGRIENACQNRALAAGGSIVACGLVGAKREAIEQQVRQLLAGQSNLVEFHQIKEAPPTPPAPPAA